MIETTCHYRQQIILKKEKRAPLANGSDVTYIEVFPDLAADLYAAWLITANFAV